MHHKGLGAEPQALSRIGTGKRTWLTRKQLLAWPIALVLVGFTVGMAVAQTHPDWPDWAGTEPASISEDLLVRAWQPSIAAGSGGRMVVAWSDLESGEASRNIYTVLSDDNGRTWSTPPQVISATAKYSALPDALVVGDQSFVAWVDQTTEGGQAFALYEAQVAEAVTVAMRSIPSSLPVLGSTRPRLAASEGRLHIVFNAGDDPSRIMYATRSLTETAWPTATVIYTATESPGSWFPMLAIDPDGETLHIVWLDLTLDERMIKYMRWDAGQADVYTLSPMDIVENTQWIHPSIAADSFGNLHVVWGEEVGTGSAENLNQYVRYARYDADTSSWSASERIYSELVKVNADDPRDVSPSLALQNKGDEVVVCVAWHGFREGAFVLAEEVLLSCSQDGEQSWSSPQNVSRSLGFDPEYPDVSIIPSITFDALGRLHCVWQERMDMKLVPYYEIYHTRVLSQVFLPLMIRSYE